ncbi:unnamed protein product [Linum trigynum]|uniref:Uncharacterized protein n=1 Tax=Linum trigynum TaxID=586398 RepID=A0AAV2CCW9_9ROSI
MESNHHDRSTEPAPMDIGTESKRMHPEEGGEKQKVVTQKETAGRGTPTARVGQSSASLTMGAVKKFSEKERQEKGQRRPSVEAPGTGVSSGDKSSAAHPSKVHNGATRGARRYKRQIIHTKRKP